MFTGLIETTATISSITQVQDGIEIDLCFAELQGEHRTEAIGDSIAIDGTCLTVTKIDGDTLSFHAIRETLENTIVGQYACGSRVNIEHACRADSRLGGHIVQGHVDCVGTITAISSEQADKRSTQPASTQHSIDIKIPRAFARYIVPKGSICLNGVSLTISRVSTSPTSMHPTPRPPTPKHSLADTDPTVLQVCLIPLTWQKTTFSDRHVGDLINVEVDVLSKYVHNACQPYLAHLGA